MADAATAPATDPAATAAAAPAATSAAGGPGAAERPPRWRGSVRTRTTLASTLVVALALVAAGAAVLAVLQRNLVGSAGLQAEVAAREVATQIAVGTSFDHLELPDEDDRPVQVVAADGTVLAAADDLRHAPPMADFARAPHRTEDSDDDRDGDDDDAPARGSAAADATFRTLALKLPGDHRPAGRDFRVAALLATAPSGRTVTVYAGASLDTERQAVGGVRDAMLLGLPPLLLLVAAVTWLVTRRALRPVEAIRAELAEIMGGDLSRRVPQPASRDEVARLARTTNATLAALEKSVERQRQFVADASHELRSPIASLRTQLEVARAHPDLLELDGLIEDTVRLERVASDLLLLARLDAGERPRAERLDLAELVRDELAHRIGDRLPVIAALPDGPVQVSASRTQLARVLGNLLDNAQRHARSAVRVAVRPGDGGTVALDVTDDGPGVPPADRERVFTRFIRLDDARTRDEGGAGLGLAIVRDVVHRHGGRIEIGDADGGGARFTVTLPPPGPGTP
ncbi:HAMP domain-containing histidine kinase [Streptomyces sp. RS10V-4]|uniref:sensor histidine kinase n=1 Tax=Streptomyces rhizoryzae TaxID=2932493 RepID=UPI002004BF19|nr:HAMP domain-containing sensor histidine kinase [Streptomyces rhizoryzae]MCK7626044.1 HAMP domain-containing histidine kinase [Streptomyces rhizoryzae]